MSFLTLGTVSQAQIVTDQELDGTFVFTDLEGNVVENGSTIVVSELNEEGQMVIPLKAKNVSGTDVAVSLYEDLSNMPNGEWQTCLFGNCMMLTESGYSHRSLVDVSYNSTLETEWKPVSGQYATWEAKLQIHIFNIVSKTTPFGSSIRIPGEEIIGYGPVVTVRFEYKDPSQQTSRLVMGPYTTDEVASNDEGLGLYRYPGSLKVATELPVEDIKGFDGGKVVKMRVGLANAAYVTSVFIYKVSSEGEVDETWSLDVDLNSEGWSEVDVETPYTLDMSDCEALLIGYEYTQTSSSSSYGSYPISLVQAGSNIYNTYIYGDLGSGTGWYNPGISAYGNLSVQCLVESSSFPAKDMVVLGLSTDMLYNKSGSEMDYMLAVQNFGVEEISSYSFDVLIDDEKVDTFEGTETIGSQATVYLSSSVMLPATLQRGDHTLALVLKTVDGGEPAGNLDDDDATTEFKIYEQSVPRQKNLIEQFTSQYCTYCPIGVTLISDLCENRDDIAWVSVHGNMSTGSDVYYSITNDTIMAFEGVTGFPSASFNRTYIPEMAESDGVIAYSLGYNLSYREQVVQMLSQLVDYTTLTPSFATLNISQLYNPETRQLDITVEGTGVEHAAEILSGYGLTVMLTENGLVARQLNQGKWVQNYEHHYVLRNVLTKCTGDDINWQGDNFTAKFSFTIPESYVKDNMFVVAFIAPKVDLSAINTKEQAVNNCEMVAVKDAVNTAIRNINADVAAEKRFAVDGRQLQSLQKGLNIVRKADGTVRKMVVRH